MAILDQPARSEKPHARQIKLSLVRMMEEVQARLSLVKGIVDDKGRSAVDSDFGADATEFSTLYAAAKTFLEANSDLTADNLPV